MTFKRLFLRPVGYVEPQILKYETSLDKNRELLVNDLQIITKIKIFLKVKAQHMPQ